MAIPQKKIHTIEDIYALPEGQRAELIDGQIYSMAPPNRIHQKLVSQFDTLLRNYIHDNHGLCDVYPAPFAVNLDTENKDWVEPDISVICNPNKLTDQGCSGAPDIIIEIVSSSSREKDYLTKCTLYSKAGVREYWIVDPQKETTMVYHFEEDAAPALYPFDIPVSFCVFPDLSVTISDLL